MYEEKSCPRHQNNLKSNKYADYILVMNTNC